jgi:hypothetical protein
MVRCPNPVTYKMTLAQVKYSVRNAPSLLGFAPRTLHVGEKCALGGAAARKRQQNAEFFDLPHEQTPVDP